MLMASQGSAAWCCAASPVGELDWLNVVHLVVLAQSERCRKKNKHGEMQKWKEENKKTFILVKISCNYWQLLATSKQHPTLQKLMLFATSVSKRITASLHA